MKTKIGSILLLGVVLYSCSPKVVPVTETKEENKTTIVLTAELAEGKSIYENNCNKCHKLYNPSDYSAVEWVPILNEMQKKAHLDDVARNKIYNYLIMNK